MRVEHSELEMERFLQQLPAGSPAALGSSGKAKLQWQLRVVSSPYTDLAMKAAARAQRSFAERPGQPRATAIVAATGSSPAPQSTVELAQEALPLLLPKQQPIPRPPSAWSQPPRASCEPSPA